MSVAGVRSRRPEFEAAAIPRAARMDQFGAALAADAQPFGQYLEALLDNGFSRDEAFEMTLAAQTSWLEAIFMDAAADAP